MSSPPPEQCQSRRITTQGTYRCQREAGHPEYHGSAVDGVMWSPESCPAVARAEVIHCSRPPGHPGAHVGPDSPDGPLYWWDPRQQRPDAPRQVEPL